MNRRELAKNWSLGLFGFLAAKLLPEKKEPIVFAAEPPNYTFTTGPEWPVSEPLSNGTYIVVTYDEHGCVGGQKEYLYLRSSGNIGIGGPDFSPDSELHIG